jgi:ABC-2 type transport system permease protein
MFSKIFLFEIQNRIRRPAVYLYFAAVMLFVIFAYASGSMPLADKEHINSPYLLAFWCSGISMMMMLVSSSLMGTTLYQDIEYNTKDYYLTYPITKAGYFWGRFLGAFTFMVIIACGIIIGAYVGTKLGPLFHITDVKQYGPNKLIYYLHPLLTIALPNIFFTSCLFFGLVATLRNIKVIYFGGILLFLFYFIGVFLLSHVTNPQLINLVDPFGMNGVRMVLNSSSAAEQNNTLFPVTGDFLMNRLLWTGIGLVIILVTYFRFSFEKFFGGRRDKVLNNDTEVKRSNAEWVKPTISFKQPYNRTTLLSLIRVELQNILRDNYFWVILTSGAIFLGFVFWLGTNNYSVPDLPRTVTLLEIFNDSFPFFLFFLLLFYTGETLHRDRATRYAFINDALPPPNWVMNGSKLITLLILGAALSVLPVAIGVIVQLTKGFDQLNLQAWAAYQLLVLLPKLLETVIFVYLVHVIVNNKFAAHAVAVLVWVGVFFLHLTKMFDYNLLLYSYTPSSGISDMDGYGHMVKPIAWFDIYWLLFGALLIIVSALFFYRGISSSLKERWQLIPERFDRKSRLFTAVITLLFVTVGGYLYYNVSYLNNYLTSGEKDDRAILYEKTLKPLDSLPLPKIIRIKMLAELFPAKQQERVQAFVTVTNKTRHPISQMLLDGDELSAYSIKCNGQLIPYTNPLLYKRGMFNWFCPKVDTADFRLYHLLKPLAPGDSTTFEVNSIIEHHGFTNSLYAKNQLHNGTLFTGGLPGLGYDDDDEISSNYVRKKNGLPPQYRGKSAQYDPTGVNTLKAGRSTDLLSFDLTVSTAADQTALAPGTLVKQWRQNNRNYFHYVQPHMYAPFIVMSARYAVKHDSVQLDRSVGVNIYYHPSHTTNIERYTTAYKDALKYFSSAYGNYPFKQMTLAETPIYGPDEVSTTSLDAYAEYHTWSADLRGPNHFDFIYFNAAKLTAQQWWRFQVAPNKTAGCLVISEGLATYGALVMMERKYGKANMQQVLMHFQWPYLFIRRHQNNPEQPLIHADQWFEWSNKAGIALYGLRDLMGEDSLNAALRDFKNAYAFKSEPPFAGTNDLYRYLQKHVPDSLQYYLTDTWQKITLYDNKIDDFKVTPLSTGTYKVNLKVTVVKVHIDNKGNDVPDKTMNDYIDIGVFVKVSKDKTGTTQTNQLYLKRIKMSYGVHELSFIVKGKPEKAGIDPYSKLIDRLPNDNMKEL